MLHHPTPSVQNGANWLRNINNVEGLGDVSLMSRKPSEHSEQVIVVRRLRSADILHCAVPNGGKRNRKEAIKLTQEGVSRGAPDLLIFCPPPACPDKVGTALEMKREGGCELDLSRYQKKWLSNLEKLGWLVLVGYGARDALTKLRDAGYAVKPPKLPDGW